MNFNSVKNYVRNILITLAKRSILFYVSIYVLVIVLFAVLYYILPKRSFYQDTSKYEYDDFNQEANRILDSIKKTLIHNFKYEYDSTEVIINEWLVDVNQVTISSLDVKDFPNEFGFKIRLPMFTAIEPKIYSSLPAEVIVSFKDKMITQDKIILSVTINETIIKNTGIAIMDNSPTLAKVFFNPKKLFPFNSPNTYSIIISPMLYDDIVYFGEGYRGFPYKLQGQFIRLLYFSFGIATSNALGDIVPISRLSRILVILESLLSIIFIGLILNVIASRVNFHQTKINHKRIKRFRRRFYHK